MKTLTLDQLAQSEFALNPNASLQVTGGEVGPIRPIIKWLQKKFSDWKPGDVIRDGITWEGFTHAAGYLFTVEIVASPIDCSGDGAPDIMTGCRF